MSSSAWSIVGGLSWATVMAVMGLAMIRGMKHFDRTVEYARTMDRVGFPGVSVLRCSGWFYLVLAFFGIMAAIEGVIAVSGHLTPSALARGNDVVVWALVFGAVVLMPLTLYLYRTGRPRCLIPPQIRGWSTDEVNALFRMSTREVNARFSSK
jgi:hypothetical protein